VGGPSFAPPTANFPADHQTIDPPTEDFSWTCAKSSEVTGGPAGWVVAGLAWVEMPAAWADDEMLL
jgi:hypothetical protein